MDALMFYDSFDIAKIIVKHDMRMSHKEKLLFNIFQYDNNYLIEKYRDNQKNFESDVNHCVSVIISDDYRTSLPGIIQDIASLGREVPSGLLMDLEHEDINFTLKKLRLFSLFVNKRKIVRMKVRTLLKAYGKKRRSAAFLDYIQKCMEFYKLDAYVSNKKCDIGSIDIDTMISFKAHL